MYIRGVVLKMSVARNYQLFFTNNIVVPVIELMIDKGSIYFYVLFDILIVILCTS